MLIVVEGVDGAGKSTFCRRLDDALCDASGGFDGGVIRHKGPLERHPLEEYVLDLDDYVPGASESVICDRWHLGERIYGPLYRGKSQLDLARQRYVEMYLRSRGALLVHVTADTVTLGVRLYQRGEDFLKASDVAYVRDAYERLATRSRTVATLTVGQSDLSADGGGLQQVLTLAGALEREAAALNGLQGRFLGSPVPEVLLVGEETSPTHLRGARPMYKAPFVPYANTSGWYLLANLPEALVRRVAVVNAKEVDLLQAWRDLRYPTVVCLGREALAAAQAVGLPKAVVGHVPHPQWVRRFHHERLAEYGRVIADVATYPRIVVNWPEEGEVV